MMRTVSRTLVTLALLLGGARLAWTQTAEDIVEKHLAAIGGRAALAKLQSRTMTGTITLSTPAGDVSGPVEIVNAAPNKARTLITLDLSALGAGRATIDQRFDGTSGYVIDSLQGNRDITGGQLDLMKAAAFPSPLLNYKERGVTVELGGKEKVGDHDAFVMLIKPASGPVMREFIDAGSYLLLRMVVKVDVPQIGGTLEQTTDLLDNRDVDGVKVPFRVASTNAVQNITVVITKVEHNSTIDDSIFSKPKP